MEEDVCNLRRLATLEHSLDPGSDILLFVLGANPAWCRVEHDVDLTQQVVKTTGHRNTGFLETLF